MKRKCSFLFLLPLSICSSEVELHIQLARCCQESATAPAGCSCPLRSVAVPQWESLKRCWILPFSCRCKSTKQASSETALPPCSSLYATGSTLEYFILTCTSVFHFVAFCTKCFSLMNAWNALLWTPPPEPSKQHLLSSASSRSHLHPRTAGVLG